MEEIESGNAVNSICWSFLFLTALTVNGWASTDSEKSVESEKSTWEVVKERVRVRAFTEFMTPAFDGNPKSVPTPEGKSLMATNTFTSAWTDYEFAKDWRALYWQRVNVNFAGAPTANGMNVVARNPRFALRRTSVFNVPNLSTTYDIYIQPGLAPEATTAGRTFEGGFRTNTSYVVPHSILSFGAITEFTLSYSNQGGPGPDWYGWAMPWVSVEISKVFSTQHYATVNFMHERNGGLVYDLPMPYIQNGIGINISKEVWTAVFLNNYLVAAPQANNTWMSVWLSLSFL